MPVDRAPETNFSFKNLQLQHNAKAKDTRTKLLEVCQKLTADNTKNDCTAK